MQICTRLRWRNAMFSKRRFRIVWSDSLNLPVLSLLCAWERDLNTRTQRRQAICTSVLPASKTPVNQKSLSYHLNTLHLYPAQTRKRTKKELPNSYIKLLKYRHPIFIVSEGLVQIKVTITNHGCNSVVKCGGTAGCETAEVTFYVYRFPILFVEVFWEQH